MDRQGPLHAGREGAKTCCAWRKRPERSSRVFFLKRASGLFRKLLQEGGEFRQTMNRKVRLNRGVLLRAGDLQPDGGDPGIFRPGNVALKAIAHHGCFVQPDADFRRQPLKDLWLRLANVVLAGHGDSLEKGTQPAGGNFFPLQIGCAVGQQPQGVIGRKAGHRLTSIRHETLETATLLAEDPGEVTPIFGALNHLFPEGGIKDLLAVTKCPFAQLREISRVPFEFAPQALEGADPNSAAICMGGTLFPKRLGQAGGITGQALGVGTMMFGGIGPDGGERLTGHHFIHHQGVIQIEENGF